MTNRLLYETPYLVLFILTVAYFFVLYFGLGFLFKKTMDLLYRNRLINRISDQPVTSDQLGFEIKNSIVSMIVFGFTALPIIWLARNEYIDLLPDNWNTVIIGLLALNLWNEVHFFVFHRLLHLPFLMRKIHYIHHRSLTPTLYSVYSFHWIEALLLSSVPLTFLFISNLSPTTLFLYPITSILINFSGHCNYRFGNGNGQVLTRFGTIHQSHHSKGLSHYGFLTPFMDWGIQLFKRNR